jgi:phosphatidylethanolamine-binding protein
VQSGNELTPTNVKDQPTLTWDAEDGAYYTVIMTDPDAPNRAEPKYREVRHWLVVNVPGSKVAEGKALFEFIGSGPPKGSGLHRYVFLVYKQPGLLETDEEVTSKR